LVVLTAYGPPGLCIRSLDDFGVNSFFGVQLALLFFFGVTVSALRIIHCNREKQSNKYNSNTLQPVIHTQYFNKSSTQHYYVANTKGVSKQYYSSKNCNVSLEMVVAIFTNFKFK